MEAITFTRHALADVSQVVYMQTLVHCATLYMTKLASFHTLQQQHTPWHFR